MSQGAVRQEPIRVGLLGTGAIAQIVHLPILTEREDVTVLAVSDPEEHKARSVAERFGVPRLAEDKALMEDPELEAVFVCTPNHLHEEQAVAALEAGKHVLVERPLALTAAGARRVVDAARTSGSSVVVGMSHRWRPDVVALRSFVASGELGALHSVRGAWLNRRLPMARSTWRQKPEEAGGGAMMDLGVQALDLVLHLVEYPEFERIHCITHTGDLPVEDGAHLLASGRDGLTLSLEVSWGFFSGDDRHHARVMGSEGTGSLPPLEIYRQVGGRPLEVTPRQPRPWGGENPYTNAYRREIDDFIRTVAGRKDVPLPEDQIALMGLIEAAYRSAREGREVEL